MYEFTVFRTCRIFRLVHSVVPNIGSSRMDINKIARLLSLPVIELLHSNDNH